MPIDDLPVYEERRGWSASTVRSIVLAGVLVVGFTTLTAVTAHWLMLVFDVFVLLGLVSLLDGGIRKPVALRIDDHGIALTKSMGRRPHLLVPWSDVRFIWLTQVNSRIQRFGLSLHSTSDGIGDPGRQDYVAQMVNWGVDVERLSQVVSHYAPEVTIRNQLSSSIATS